DRLVVEIERVLPDNARAMARPKLTELPVRDFVNADVERAGEPDGTLRLIRSPTRLASRAAHRELPRRHQLQDLIGFSANRARHGSELRLCRREQLRLDELRYAGSRRNRRLVFDKSFLADGNLVTRCDQPQCLIGDAARLAIDEHL